MTPNNRFFQKNFLNFTLDQIISITGCACNTMLDAKTIITDLNTIKNASNTELTFLSSEKYLETIIDTQAGFCLVAEKYLAKIPKQTIALVHKNPYYAYSLLVSTLYKTIPNHFESQNIHHTAKIGYNTVIAPNAYIGKNVKIGENCFIGPNSTILDGVIIGNNTIINANATISFAIIGNNCQIYSGVKIGQDGFGFAYHEGINNKIMQIGIVEIGNNVEIGANTCIDRGAIENTMIGDEVKIDNLCQIAHNVIINKGTVIAGCAAIAGSTTIGKFVQIGGGANIAGHLVIGDFVKIAGMTGVMRNIESGAVVAGIPSLPIKKWHRITMLLQKMIEKN
jgi:UDP-3-O-[3-hydroxymyristoyl] glucosamine N-acyltransferase